VVPPPFPPPPLPPPFHPPPPFDAALPQIAGKIASEMVMEIEIEIEIGIGIGIGIAQNAGLRPGTCCGQRAPRPPSLEGGLCVLVA